MCVCVVSDFPRRPTFSIPRQFSFFAAAFFFFKVCILVRIPHRCFHILAKTRFFFEFCCWKSLISICFDSFLSFLRFSNGGNRSPQARPLLCCFVFGSKVQCFHYYFFFLLHFWGPPTSKNLFDVSIEHEPIIAN